MDYEDKRYKRLKIDLKDSLYEPYVNIENVLVEAKAKKRSVLADKVTGDNIYKALIYFVDFYDKMN